MSETPDQWKAMEKDGKQCRRPHTTISKTYKTSTPCGNVSLKRYSVSLSQIDTASSSSGSRITRKLQSRIVGKRKKGLRNGITAKKSRRVKFQLEDTDSEWETKSEEFIDEFPSSRDDESEADGIDSRCINLFESLPTPEKVRDAPIRFEEVPYESPIIGSSRRSRPISKSIDIMLRDRLLPIRSPSAESQNPLDTDEDELMFHRGANVRTYAVARKSRKSPEEKLGDFMFSARVPTLISDRLWDRFIAEHRGKTSRYLAPALSARELPDSSTNSASSDVLEKSETHHGFSSERIRERGKIRNTNSRKWESFGIDRDFKRGIQRSERRERGREMRSKTKRKKTTEILPSARRQSTDVYDRSNETDIEFETGGKNYERMSLSEFRRSRNVNKVFTELSLTSLESDTE